MMLNLRRSHFIMLFGLLLILSLSSIGLSATASNALGQPSSLENPAKTASSLLETSAFSLTAPNNSSIPFGKQAVFQIIIKNNTSVAHTPYLYEAWPVPAAGVVPQEALSPYLQHVALPDQPTRIDAQLMSNLAANSAERTPFLVFLTKQADLSPAYQISDWQQRGRWVYQTLHDHAAKSQQALQTDLTAQGIPFEPLWIVNALIVAGTQADVQTLAARSDVAMLRANHTTSLDNKDRSPVLFSPLAQWQNGGTFQTFANSVYVPSYCNPDSRNICWDIRKINADRVWYDFGVAGQGITVANLDSGVAYEHPALAQQYRGYRGAGTFDHNYNWFDPQGIAKSPIDTVEHGTHVMGTMVGRGNGSETQPAVGVAPAAHWIAARGCRSGTCYDIDLLKAAEWFLAPTDLAGQNPQADLRPHVINNSWAGESGSNQYQSYMTAWRAAGIFPVFANGNTNSISCGSVASPGEYPTVFGVGATKEDDQIASFSRVGPTSDGRIKPDLSAPGNYIVSTGLSKNYIYKSGTSMAAPHVAGAVALLWSANPALLGDYEATYKLLTQNAVPRTDSNFAGAKYEKCHADQVPNNIYGYGRLDTYAAVQEAKVDVPWLELPQTVAALGPKASRILTVTVDTLCLGGPGKYQARVLLAQDNLSQALISTTLSFTVTQPEGVSTLNGILRDAETSAPLAGKVALGHCAPKQTAPTGSFTLTLPAKETVTELSLQASSTNYLSRSFSLDLQNRPSTTQLFSLTADIPRLLLPTKLLSATLSYGEYANRIGLVQNVGTQPLSYTLELPSTDFGVWQSNETKEIAFKWLSLPSTSSNLFLTDNGVSGPLELGFPFPFYTEFFTQIYVTANGVLTFEEPPEIPFQATCLPIPETKESAILPLRIDLDPSTNGQIRAAQVSEGFIISFEAVQLKDEPSKRFSFQVLLRPDGRIQFHYKQVGALPGVTTVGLQHSSSEFQEFGCGQTLPLTNNLALEFRPQPRSTTWLSLPRETKGAVTSQQEKSFTLRLNWVSPVGKQPYRSKLLLKSNDPRQPSVSLPVELTTNPNPALQTIWLPLIIKR